MDDLGGKPHYFRKHPSILSKIQFPVFSKQKGGLPDGTLPLSWWAICPLKNRLKKTSRTSDPMGRPIEKSNGVNGKCKEGFPPSKGQKLICWLLTKPSIQVMWAHLPSMDGRCRVFFLLGFGWPPPSTAPCSHRVRMPKNQFTTVFSEGIFFCFWKSAPPPPRIDFVKDSSRS